MIFAHAFIGMIIAFAYESVYRGKGVFSNQRQKMALWTSAILGSIFPDCDILYLIFINPQAYHRELLTHSMIPYLFVLALIIGGSRLHQYTKIQASVIAVFFIGILFHLIGDSFVDKVYLFKPFSNFSFQFEHSQIDKNKGFLGYFHSSFMLAESMISLLGFGLFIKSFANFHKQFRLLLSFIAIIEAGVFIALLPFLYSFN